MKRAGHGAAYVFTLWSGIGLVTALASVAGYKLGAHLTPEFVAATQGVAGGALIAMIADTMIPEAFHDSQEATGLSAAFGFLVGFFLSHGIG
jgi:zinc transporter, ZIP family